MKRTVLSKAIALVLCAVMCIGTLPATAFASIPNWEENNVVYDGTEFGTNGYYNVISKKDYVLVPGAAVESEIVLNNDAGNRRQVMHIIEVDPSNPDVSIVPGYSNIDKDVTQEENWAHSNLTDMAKYYEDNLGYNIVGGMNTDLYYDTYAPRVLVYNGKDLSVKGKTSPTSSILYVFKDENGEVSCDVKAFNRTEFDNYLSSGKLMHAVGVSFGMVVKDGELVSKTEERTSAAAARSMVGIKEDGTLVICMNDGRGANNSVGFCNYEEGEAMLALGCKWAANCDGGGSSTFLTKRTGEDTFTMRSVPCDGAQRPTAHGVFVTSNVAPTGILGNVNIESEYDLFAPGTKYTFNAEAVDTNGYAMEMPSDISWKLSDESFGTISNGEFVSNGKLGDVTIQVVSSGEVVGKKNISITNPTTLKMSSESTTLPYSTEAKKRTITLPIVAKVGEADVYYDTTTFSITASADNVGIIDGFKYTAPTESDVTGNILTIKYLPQNIELKFTVNFGKGSEVLWDFENDDLGGFLGQRDAAQWQKDNGIKEPLKSILAAGNASLDVTTKSFIATKENGGQVHNGKSSLGYELDMRYLEAFNSWAYANIYNVSNVDGSGVLRDVENGKLATTLGAWVYVPKGFYTVENAGALALRGDFVAGVSKEKAVRTNFNATYKGKTLNSLTEADIPDNRWIYAEFALGGYNYVSINDPLSTDNYSPCFARMYVKPSRAQKLTYYFDDFTLDYSSAVDDRNPPVISNATYCTTDTNIEIAGQTITTAKVSLNANVKDFDASNAEGLDYSTAAIYIDGNKLPNVNASGSVMGVEDVVLSNGTHSIKFEIADKIGNVSTLTKTLVVESESARTAVFIDGHNDLNNTPEMGSVYYIDIKAKDISKIKDVSTTIELGTGCTWELDNMIVAEGFDADYSVREAENEFATINIKKTSKTSLTGEEILVSIPVRVWAWNEEWQVSGGILDSFETLTTAERFAVAGSHPIVTIDADVISGTIKYSNNTEGTFGGNLSKDTALINAAKSWHTHDEELTVQNKDVTCTEDGYANRTYCETCGSVIDWGTKTEAEGHNFVIADGKFVCTNDNCGVIYESGTGIFEMNGELYYSINNELKTGWQTVDDGYCYAGSNYKVYIGKRSVNSIIYDFGEDGVMSTGAWVKNSKGIRYSYGPGFYSRMWKEIDGKTYYFGRDAYMYTGIRFVKDNPDVPAIWYDFGTDGATDKDVHPKDGLYEVNGNHYIVKNGETVSGLHYIDGAYYYGGIGSGFDEYWYIAKNKVQIVNSEKANGLLNSGTYEFGPDGKMIIYNGTVNGYLYIDGNMQHCYKLVKYNDEFYYVGDAHKYVVNKKVYITADKLEGTGLPAGYYDFDAEGKMIIKNGPQEDGTFYINGAKQQAYRLVAFKGNYYFISDYNKYITNKTQYVTADKLEGTGLPAGYYDFDAEGKMIIKNGPQEDGSFYINGAKQKAYQLVKFDGNYYFISDYNKYITNKTQYVTADKLEGTGLPAGYYDFDAEGKMVIKNGPQKDGSFYKNGVKLKAYQLVEFGGNYYFISDYNKYITNKKQYVSKDKLIGTEFAAGYYEFDAEGKMII